MKSPHKTLALIAGFFWAFAGSLPAQTIRVQSGDHQGFTRLVLPIGADREWDLTQRAGNQWNLTLTPPTDGFDTSTVFNLIQRNRLSNLIASDALTLDLACNCDVTTFRHDSRFLVIDISDPDPNAPPSEPEISNPVSIERATTDALPDLANLLRTPGGLPSVTSSETTQPIVETEAQAPNPRLAEAAQIMAEQLARAAASGLLDIAPTEATGIAAPMEQADSQPVLMDEVNQFAEPAILDSPDEAAPSALPVRAETAFDAHLQQALPLGRPATPSSCTNTPFSVASWAEDDDLYRGIGELRRSLYDERDILIADAAVGLAQHYLYFGLGAEATYWLEQTQSPPESLLHVATLVDGAETASFIPVEPWEECSQGELLWRYLGGAVPTALNAEDTAAIQRAFGNLPPGLRDHMGPRLSMQLQEDGYGGTARNIRDILHRGGRIDAIELQLLDLDLGIDPENNPEQTRIALEEALRDGDDPVTALSLSLAYDRSVGTLPAPSRLITADALMRELGPGPETDDLWRETLLGHAALGQVDEAISRLGDPTRSNAARAEALTDLIAERVEVGDTAALVILAYTFGRDWRPEGSAAGRVQVQAIAALRDEGLFEAAQVLRDVRRPLILPAQDAPEDTPEDEALIAWQDRNWARLAGVGSGPHADIAERITQLDSAARDVPLIVAPPDLNFLNEQLQDSRAMRATIADLLADPALR